MMCYIEVFFIDNDVLYRSEVSFIDNDLLYRSALHRQ